jgi:hypothetical protein
MDWIYLAQNRDRWPALVNAVMNLHLTQNAGDLLTSRGRRMTAACIYLLHVCDCRDTKLQYSVLSASGFLPTA